MLNMCEVNPICPFPSVIVCSVLNLVDLECQLQASHNITLMYLSSFANELSGLSYKAEWYVHDIIKQRVSASLNKNAKYNGGLVFFLGVCSVGARARPIRVHGDGGEGRRGVQHTRGVLHNTANTQLRPRPHRARVRAQLY